MKSNYLFTGRFFKLLLFYLTIVVLFVLAIPLLKTVRNLDPVPVPVVAPDPPATMNAFLRRAKQLLTLQDPLLLIVGNESCDLDSAISALSLALFYSAAPPESRAPGLRQIRADRIVPVLNVARRMLPAKTEVTYLLREQNIELENVVCSDELPPAAWQRASIILVDHHVSPLANRTIQVLDHRPFDAVGAAQLPAECDRRIETVGSCCTLIGDMVLKNSDSLSPASLSELLRLLYPVIVLDTVNFSAAADRARPLDSAVCERIEASLALGSASAVAAHRLGIFERLVQARSDVSALDAPQLLAKDMKVVHSKRLHVVMPGFPIALRQFSRMPAAAEAVGQLASENQALAVVMQSLTIGSDDVVQRELAVVQTEQSVEASRIVQDLLRELCSPAADLRLRELSSEEHGDVMGGRFFAQDKLKASRKQVMPIVQRVLNAAGE